MGSIIGEGITFDDVLLVPAYSEVIPNEVSLDTHLTKKIKLNIPMMNIQQLYLLNSKKKMLNSFMYSTKILLRLHCQ